jgi:hypothetical protein
MRAILLRDVARKLDPPPRPLTRQGTMAARQRDGGAIYRLTGSLTEVEALHHVRVESALELLDGLTEAILLASHRDADSALI